MMGALKYEPINPIPHAEAESIFAGNDPMRIAQTLIALGLHDNNWEWVQQIRCASYPTNGRSWFRQPYCRSLTPRGLMAQST